jgi:hypothetical protein
MKKNWIILLLVPLLLAACGESNKFQEKVSKDLSVYWDTITPLANPDKGWYHHLLDGGVEIYDIKDQSVLEQFPGMDHMYLRIAWSYFEPREGEYDWSIIDKIIDEYVPKGYGISFRITSKETGTYPGSVGQEFDGVQYATPKWVRDAGAKGTVTEMWGIKSWTPVWDDPVYLQKLDNFHRAFAERYDNLPFVRYTDVGSVGDWGEGHTHFSTRIPPTLAEVKANMDVFHRNYKSTLVVVTDDLLYYGKSNDDANELFNYARSLGFTFRDDSPLVDWYIQHNADTWSVSHPHFFEKAHPHRPIIYELQHYPIVKREGNWLGENGEEKLPGKDFSGADLFRGSLKLIRATYIGYQGYMEDWYRDNPKLTGELLNMCGYWFFPNSVTYNNRASSGEPFEFSIEWLNKGVARAYNNYLLWVKLESADQQIFQLENASTESWLPDHVVSEQYKINLPEALPEGQYKVKLKLTTAGEDRRDVQLGLQNQIKDSDGFHELFTIHITSK